MPVLLQFADRLALGLGIALCITSAARVDAGFFRVHAYVIMGLQVLAALAAWSKPELSPWWLPTLAALLAYVSSVMWLYRKKTSGKIALAAATAAACLGAWWGIDTPEGISAAAWLMRFLDPISGGLVLGGTCASMLLGHWYLNEPSMDLRPLKKLILLMLGAIGLRMILSGGGLAGEYLAGDFFQKGNVWFVVMRWGAGLIGAGVTGVMSWETLKIPNTQSATGILYVGVITTFIGELTGQLLARETLFPL